MEYKYTGIILNKRDVGETDRIYSMYTLEGGKVQALAKGVRKSRAKLAGSLENFTLADITVMRTRGMGKITGSIVEKNHTFLKRDYAALANALQGVHFFNRLVDLDHCDVQVFRLLEEYLETVDLVAAKKMEQEKAFDLNILVQMGFLMKLLNILGYTVVVNNCACCGLTLEVNQTYFSPAHGGIICTGCKSEARDAMPISVNVIKLLRIFLQNKLEMLEKIKISRRDLFSTQRILGDFLNWV